MSGKQIRRRATTTDILAGINFKKKSSPETLFRAVVSGSVVYQQAHKPLQNMSGYFR